MESIDTINKRLLEFYGRTLDGRALFRVVWSTHEREMRVGDFAVFYGSIFIRTESGAKLCDKYPFAKDRYILERLIQLPNPEILNSEHGSYEPIFVFQDNQGNALPVIWRAVEYIMHTILFAEKPPPVTEHDEIVGREVEVDKDTQYFIDYMENKAPEMAVKMKEGSAVSLYRKETNE